MKLYFNRIAPSATMLILQRALHYINHGALGLKKFLLVLNCIVKFFQIHSNLLYSSHMQAFPCSPKHEIYPTFIIMDTCIYVRIIFNSQHITYKCVYAVTYTDRAWLIFVRTRLCLYFISLAIKINTQERGSLGMNF